MDIRKVKQLIKLLEDSELSEIEIRSADDSVRVSRASHPNVPVHTGYALAHPIAQQSNMRMDHPPSHHTDPAGTASQPPTAQTTADPGHAIKSPMVGTFYRAPNPQDPPFVSVGSPVKVGSILCIVEAMKMLNQIESDRAGVITAILVETGQPVEFGQPLFMIGDP